MPSNKLVRGHMLNLDKSQKTVYNLQPRKMNTEMNILSNSKYRWSPENKWINNLSNTNIYMIVGYDYLVYLY